MDAIKVERAALQERIDTAMQMGNNEKGGLNDLRSQMNTIKAKKQKLIDEKKAMRAQLDQHKAAGDKLLKDKKDVRSNLKFGTLAEIEAEIKNLQRQQETTTMTLQQEKKLIKDMDALAASKKLVAVVQAKDVAMDDVQQLRKLLQANIQEKDKEIDAVTKELDVVMKGMKDINEKDTSKRDAMQALFAERDAFKTRVSALIQEKDSLRNAFREENNAWYTYQRGLRAQKKMQYEAEKQRREEEWAAKQAAIEAEIAKTIPYEEEQNLCEFLADYLERTYLGKVDESDSALLLKGKPEPIVAVTDNPFAGLKAVTNTEDEIFFAKGKQKKKRVRAAKEEKAADTAVVPFVLSADLVEQFGLLQLTPPISAEQVPESVEALNAKKAWFKEQPRGSVPTVTDIRRQRAQAAAAAAKEQQQRLSGPKGKKVTNFSLAAEDFAPLGATVTLEGYGMNANWGKTSAAPALADDDANGTAEEAEAAAPAEE
jgi:uncharacterized coiled-coil DUF342 family protein